MSTGSSGFAATLIESGDAWKELARFSVRVLGVLVVAAFFHAFYWHLRFMWRGFTHHLDDSPDVDFTDRLSAFLNPPSFARGGGLPMLNDMLVNAKHAKIRRNWLRAWVILIVCIGALFLWPTVVLPMLGARL